MKNLKISLLALFVLMSVFSFGKIVDNKSTISNENMWKSLSAYDVKFDSLGHSSCNSMPLGNGDIGLNVWTEQNGDVLFYISKSDAWEEADNLVKVGRVRVSLSPNPFAGVKTVQQVLKLKDGEIQVSNGLGTVLKVWVDANHPVVRVQVSSPQPLHLKATLDPWRTEPSVYKNTSVSADVVKVLDNKRIAWYHRNEPTKGINENLLNRTFGGLMQGNGMVKGDGNILMTVAPQKEQSFSVSVLTATTPTAQDWISQITQLADENKSLDVEKSYLAHKTWWQNFWQRSWIFISGDAAATQVSRGYVLQRFKTACAGRGAYPIKFNGSIFTVDNPIEKTGKDKATGKDILTPVNADYRAWGGQYWFQNTRPMYWPRLASGDFDLMQPLFNMFKNILPANAKQVRDFYGHDGAYFAETAPFWGGIPNIKPESKGSYTFRYFTPILELSAMMLDYYAYTGDKKFARETLLPIANAGLTFFEKHFPRDEKGKLFLDKDNSIEMYWDVKNPLPDIAGLRYVLERLAELPADVADANQQTQWQNFLKIIPEIPVGMKNGKKVILPYEPQDSIKARNSENPELYALFPFRLYGLGKPNYQLALETFNERVFKRTGCWHQDVVDAPMLGLTGLSKKYVTTNFTTFDKRLSFPAFWDRGHDYMPDEDNGGQAESGLQKMLMQCDGKRILLIPAWPKEWNVSFKLSAPYNTTVEGRVENGKVLDLKVLPESRLKDVVVYYGNPESVSK